MELLKIQKVASSYGKTVNFLNSWGILPFVWCDEHQRISLKLPSKLWTLFQLSLILFHEVFLMFQTVRTWRNENYSLFDRVYVSFNMFGFLVFHMNFFVVLSNLTMHPQLINNLLRTVKTFYGKRFDKLKPQHSNILLICIPCSGGNVHSQSVEREKILIKILVILRIAVFLILPMTQVLLPTLQNPALPTLFTSMLPRPSETFILVRLVIGVAQFYIVISHFGMLAYNMSTVAMFFFLIPDILKNMR